MAGIEELLDPTRLEQIVRALEAIASSVGSADREIGNLNRTLKESEKRTTDVDLKFGRFYKNVTAWTNELGKRYDYFIRFEFLSGTENAIRRASARWQAYGKEIDRHLNEARGPIGAAGSAIGLSGNRSVVRGMAGQFQQVMGSLPFGVGGLMGVMLYGKKREEEFDAAAMRTARVFSQFGQQAGAAANVRSRIVEMYEAFGEMGETFGSVLSQFNQFNMASIAFEKAGVSAGQFGDDLLGVATALAHANSMDPAGFAQMLGTVFEAGGTNRKQLLGDFMELDRLAQASGVSIERLMSSMSQSASTLCLQRQGVADLGEAYAALRSGLAGGAMRGAESGAIGAAAMRGVQAAASGLGGLSEGLMATLAERMGRGGGVQGVVGFQEGFGGGNGRFAGETFRALGDLAREVTGNGGREEQIFALQKIAPSLGFEGARAVVDMMLKGGSLKDIQQAIKDPQQKLLEAFEKQKLEESPWESVMRVLMTELAKIGSSMLSVTMAGFDVLANAALAPFGAGDVVGAYSRFEAASLNMVDQATEGFSKAIGTGVTAADLPIPLAFQQIQAKRRNDKEREEASMKADTERARAQYDRNVDDPNNLLTTGERIGLITAIKNKRPLPGQTDRQAAAVAIAEYLKEHGLRSKEFRSMEGVKFKLIQRVEIEEPQPDRIEMERW